MVCEQAAGANAEGASELVEVVERQRARLATLGAVDRGCTDPRPPAQLSLAPVASQAQLAQSQSDGRHACAS